MLSLIKIKIKFNWGRKRNWKLEKKKKLERTHGKRIKDELRGGKFLSIDEDQKTNKSKRKWRFKKIYFRCCTYQRGKQKKKKKQQTQGVYQHLWSPRTGQSRIGNRAAFQLVLKAHVNGTQNVWKNRWKSSSRSLSVQFLYISYFVPAFLILTKTFVLKIF